MREVRGNLWSFENDGALVVPTNLCVRADGLAVMGRGVALEAAHRYPELPREYGRRLRAGARGLEVWEGTCARLVLLPTKEDWRGSSSLGLIERGVRELAACEAVRGTVFLPLLGCGCGGLMEGAVLTVLRQHLRSARFVLVRRVEGKSRN